MVSPWVMASRRRFYSFLKMLLPKEKIYFLKIIIFYILVQGLHVILLLLLISWTPYTQVPHGCVSLPVWQLHVFLRVAPL